MERYAEEQKTLSAHQNEHAVILHILVSTLNRVYRIWMYESYKFRSSRYCNKKKNTLQNSKQNLVI